MSKEKLKLSTEAYHSLSKTTFKRIDIHSILRRIIALNHAWKIARDDFGAQNSITNALRRQKASWQASLLRYYPEAAYFKADLDNVDGETLLSVRLTTPINIDGVTRKDAEHMPVRIATQLFTEEELNKLTR